MNRTLSHTSSSTKSDRLLWWSKAHTRRASRRDFGNHTVDVQILANEVWNEFVFHAGLAMHYKFSFK